MSKQDNLTDFLTDVADAIREKKGTTDKINPQNFSEEIRGIESGGISTAKWNDVNFYDYDGTILYSYTWDEFVVKNEMPPLPTHHDGLTCQEWNYTLEEVLEQGGRCDVGATYIPSNGRTQIYIEVPNNFEISFNITPTVADDVVIYWGDNILDNLSEVKTYTITHTYENSGVYCIEIENINKTKIVFNTKQNIYRNIHIGNIIQLGALALANLKIDKLSLSNKTTLEAQVFNNFNCDHITLPRGINTPIHYMQTITSKTVSLPNNIEMFHDNFFLNASNLLYLHTPSSISTAYNSWGTELGLNLRKISVSKANTVFYEQNNCMIEKSTKRLVKGTSYSTIPNDVITIDYAAFKGCKVLLLILIPNSVTSINTCAFASCTSLTSITIPNEVTSIGSQAFYGCTGLTLFNFEETSKVDTIGLYAFRDCTSLTEFNMPDSVITLDNYAFLGCTKLLKITMSANVSKISTYTFYNCAACECFDFSKCNSIPLLVTTNAFTLTKDTSKIVVPDNLYKDWINASNWSNYASRIISKTTWEEQNQ